MKRRSEAEDSGKRSSQLLYLSHFFVIKKDSINKIIMAKHFDDKPMRETDATAGSAADDRFEEIIKRVKAAGAEINKDTTGPLYIDLDRDEVEIGEQRIVEFNLNKMDFQITRNVKNVRITGDGYHKSLEDLDRPIIEIKLKRKPELEDDWVVMDLEDMF